MDERSPSVSVIIACSSTRDSPLDTVHALLAQDCSCPLEILLVAPSGVLPRAVDGRVRRICHEGSSIPELRAAGWASATGDLVGVLGCYCVPGAAWVRTAVRLFCTDKSLNAVGGPVRHESRGAADAAGFLCEYGRVRIAAGRTVEKMPLPGMNVMYRRAVLEMTDPAGLKESFWEEFLHPMMEPGSVKVDAGLTVTLARHFEPGWYSKQRFQYSRHFAASRFRHEPTKKWLYRLLVPFLPPVLLFRIVLRDGFDALRVLPYLSWFILVWTAGEFVGTWKGPGDAVKRVE